jgi:hypothetical protein
MFRIALLLTLALAGTALSAQKIAGQDAPDFDMKGIVNQYGPTAKADLAGEIIVMKTWGPN